MMDKMSNLVSVEIARLIGSAPDSINPDTPLSELGVDSLQALQLMVFLERTLGLEIDESDLQYFDNVTNIAGFIGRRISGVELPHADQPVARMERS